VAGGPVPLKGDGRTGKVQIKGKKKSKKRKQRRLGNRSGQKEKKVPVRPLKGKFDSEKGGDWGGVRVQCQRGKKLG